MAVGCACLLQVVLQAAIRSCAFSGDFNDKTAEPWGDELWESYTTANLSDGVLVAVRQDICVQVFPVYPFLQRSILQCRPVYDMRGCPTFVLWLPRDLNAHLFWKRRDLLAPYFWNDDGTPGVASLSIRRLHTSWCCTLLLIPLKITRSASSIDSCERSWHGALALHVMPLSPCIGCLTHTHACSL
jgi:hypothetical protein